MSAAASLSDLPQPERAAPAANKTSATRVSFGKHIAVSIILAGLRRRLAVVALLAALTMPAVAPADGAALGSWSAGPRLGAGREFHTANLITRTGLLVAGGLRASGPTATSEIFDSRTRRWSRAAPLAKARIAHAGATLFGGRVLVSGGGTLSATSPAGYLSSAELYDPGSNSWRSAGEMSVPRANHTATLLADGRILVTGGLNSFGRGVAGAEIYNPATNSWSTAGRMREARYHHTATLLPNRRVLVAGGHQLTGEGSTVALSSAELYDPATNSWLPAPRMRVPRDNHTATSLPGGRVLVTGGGTRTAGFVRGAESYDWAANRWSGAGRLHEPRAFHAAALLPGGSVVAVGGFDDCGALAGAEVFSPRAGRWRRTRSLRTPRGQLSATAFPDGQVIAAGGSTIGGSILSNSDLFVPGGADKTGPRLCGLRVSQLRLRAARTGPSISRRGLPVAYRVSEPGVVSFIVRRLKRGRLRDRRCGASRGRVPRRLRCTRSVRMPGSFRQRSRSGRNRFGFTGRIGGRTLPPGAYQLLAKPRDRRRNAGVVVDSAFRIVR